MLTKLKLSRSRFLLGLLTLPSTYRVAGRKADLVVTAITVTPATPVANSNFTLAVTMKNQGTTFILQLYFLKFNYD